MKITSSQSVGVSTALETSASSQVTPRWQPPQVPSCTPESGSNAALVQEVIEFMTKLLTMLLEGITKGVEGAASSLSSSIAPLKGSAGGGGVSNEFLWKPSSEKDGKLVVLLPAELTGKVRGIEIKGPEGRTLEGGKFAGVHNGGREHFRFSQPGASFPAGSQVHIHLRDGNTRTINIANPGSRVTR